MKLKLALLCVLGSILFSSNAFAEDSLEVCYKRAENTITISGTTEEAGYARLMVLKPQTDVKLLSNAEIWENMVYADEVQIENGTFDFETFSMPENTSEGEYIIRVMCADGELKKTIQYATVARAKELLLCASDSQTAMACIEKYNDAYGFDLTVYNKFGNDGKLWVTGRVLADNAADIPSFENKLYVYSALWQVKSQPWAVVRQIIEGHNNLLGVSYTYYSGLSDAEKDSVSNSLSGQLYLTPQAFCEAFNLKVSEVISGRNQISHNGGGSGGGGGVSFGTISSGTPSEALKETGKKEVFTDISAHSWAKDSIELLHQKGIINGRGNGRFAPDEYITRAEAAKLIILAFGELSDTAECEFSDVSKDTWMYPYIATSVEKDIIFGYGNGCFGAGDYITREDFAVLILRGVRAYGVEVKSSEAKPEFADFENISEYAKEAVSDLFANNIISGYGDGTFMPKLGATRAQAAKIIAGLL